ncbi:hypothetical protein AB0M44_04325 [Streptosporangium subroseum]|uniref:hypothetical protein n=1 Tax=Streptosporangium subroseum TaxID=106412 RepID=UPI003415CCB2
MAEIGYTLMSERTPTRQLTDGAAETVRPEDIAEATPCGAGVDAAVEAVREYTDAGFTHVALVQIGHEHQREFFDRSKKEPLPALRGL